MIFLRNGFAFGGSFEKHFGFGGSSKKRFGFGGSDVLLVGPLKNRCAFGGSRKTHFGFGGSFVLLVGLLYFWWVFCTFGRSSCDSLITHLDQRRELL